MNTPYRIATPPEPVRTEEADSYEARLQAGRRRYWLQMSVLLGGAIVLSGGVVRASHRMPTGAEKARKQEALRVEEARQTVREARAQLDRAEDEFDAAVRDAIDHHRAPTLPLAACAVGVGDPERFVHGHSTIPLLIARAGERRYYSPSIAHVGLDVSTAQSLLYGANPMAATVYTDALASNTVDQRLARDVVVVPSKWKPPARSSETSFEPGQVEGIAYVFDFATRKIACAGEVHASNSKSLAYTYNETYDVRGVRLDGMLNEDLDRQIARAVAEPNALFSIY